MAETTAAREQSKRRTGRQLPVNPHHYRSAALETARVPDNQRPESAVRLPENPHLEIKPGVVNPRQCASRKASPFADKLTLVFNFNGLWMN
jgi:hypothetical protein